MSPLRRKPDGIRNPDGSWFEVPSRDPPPTTPDPSAPAVAPSSATPSAAAADGVRQLLREIASRGGKARAARYSRAELAAWGRVRHKSKPTR
jgi:hypothetical protein